jgi:hypothetical protein
LEIVPIEVNLNEELLAFLDELVEENKNNYLGFSTRENALKILLMEKRAERKYKATSI